MRLFKFLLGISQTILYNAYQNILPRVETSQDSAKNISLLRTFSITETKLMCKKSTDQ